MNRITEILKAAADRAAARAPALKAAVALISSWLIEARQRLLAVFVANLVARVNAHLGHGPRPHGTVLHRSSHQVARIELRIQRPRAVEQHLVHALRPGSVPGCQRVLDVRGEERLGAGEGRGLVRVADDDRENAIAAADFLHLQPARLDVLRVHARDGRAEPLGVAIEDHRIANVLRTTLLFDPGSQPRMLLRVQGPLDRVRAARAQAVRVHGRLALLRGDGESNRGARQHHGVHAPDPVPLQAVEHKDIVRHKLTDHAELVPAAVADLVARDPADVPLTRLDRNQLLHAAVVAAYLD